MPHQSLYYTPMPSSSVQHIIVSRFLFSLAYHVLLPTMPLFLLDTPYSLSLPQLAIALAVYGFCDRGMALLCPPLLPKLGSHRAQQLGVAISTAAMIALACSTHFIALLACFVIFGFGNSLSGLATRIYFSHSADADARIHSFSKLYVAYNAGAALGVLLPFFFNFRGHGPLLFAIAAALGTLSLLALLGIAPLTGEGQRGSWSQLWHTIRSGTARSAGVFHGLRYCSYTIVMVFLFVQSFELLPVFFEKTTGAWSHWGWVFALNAVMVVTMQTSITRRFKPLIQARGDLPFAIGAAWMAAGAATMAIWWHPHAAWILMICYTLAEMIVAPHTEYTISTHVAGELRAVFYALNVTGISIGRAAAGFFGVRYLDQVTAGHITITPWWWSMAIIALVWSFVIARVAGNIRAKSTSHTSERGTP